jgi:hypothetical protein
MMHKKQEESPGSSVRSIIQLYVQHHAVGSTTNTGIFLALRVHNHSNNYLTPNIFYAWSVDLLQHIKWIRTIILFFYYTAI